MTIDWGQFDEDNQNDRPVFIGGRAMYYDKQARPIGLWTWVRLNEDWDYRFIGKTHMLGYTVSTVWMGIDHSFGYGPPVLFETMIFTPEYRHYPMLTRPLRQSMDLQWRYETEVEAYAGHWLASELLRAELSNRAVLGPRAPKMLE